MLFNSIPYFIFFSIFLLIYWVLFKDRLKLQNIALLIGSYIFYCWWDWRFLPLLIGSSLINYLLGIAIFKAKKQKAKSLFLLLGLIQGLGSLFIFKYYNFFITSLTSALTLTGITSNLKVLELILPLGISFYTFRTLSYLIDIDKGKYAPTTDGVAFFSYVAFFPSLLSGPIDRPNFLIPQLERSRQFDYSMFVTGMRQILWGMFKKIVIADNCAAFTNPIFENYTSLSGSTMLLGAVLYAVQLYADFSGYSDMAIGFARLIGFKITQNFDYPFFAQNIAEYWRRWHISLTSWLTEYVFTPLSISFRDYGKFGLFLAILINFVLVGLWHGANWTYVVFGFINGCLYIPLIVNGTMNKKKKIAKNQVFPTLYEARNMIFTFTIVMFTDILFRSESFTRAINFISRIFSRSLFSAPVIDISNSAKIALLFVPIMFAIEWVQRNEQFGLQIERLKSQPARLFIYYSLIISIIMFGGFSNKAFIYFQF